MSIADIAVRAFRAKTIAYDTETDMIPGCEVPRTVLIQICAVDAHDDSDVYMIEGTDCFERFFEAFECVNSNIDCHCYNLKYEWSRIYHGYITRANVLYDYWESDRESETREKQPVGTWSILEDTFNVYCVTFVNSRGYKLKMTDDSRRFAGGQTMAKTASQIRKSNPDWWPDDTGVKLETEYNHGWFSDDSDKHKNFLMYSARDAYSQAMITRWLDARGFTELTSASHGLDIALLTRYNRPDAPVEDRVTGGYREIKQAKEAFAREYPPLSRDMQDIVEDSLLGGFVYGDRGQHFGTFVHVDYSSSYPYEYAFGKLFRGVVKVVMPSNPKSAEILKSKTVFRWVLVSYRFDGLNPVGMPAITRGECETSEFCEFVGIRYKNKKMRSGVVSHRLYTETYFEELQQHYNISDIVIHEIWYAKRSSQDFYDFIEMCYVGKEKTKDANGKNTVESNEFKLLMNGGVHGKTITKTRRRSITYRTGVRTGEMTVSKPLYCALIGFSAMQNARERLLRDCRKVQECGLKVLMCDTDSMVIEATEQQARDALGESIRPDAPNGDMRNLGRFDFETYENQAEFDEFCCWGLKQYMEVQNDSIRKTAFAGMRISVQEKILPSFPFDGSLVKWQQKAQKTTEWGIDIVDAKKSAKSESIWYDDFTSEV